MNKLIEALEAERSRLLNIYRDAPEEDLDQLDAKITRLGQEIKLLKKQCEKSPERRL
ncbi:hypothetical protein ASZ90_017562 [hydrocarbon metagenome]|uniref:Uncharacterized protein n=1 Tax=hydrocarbon metagenome TaxID=938273 RepID=A0A0W8E9K6_9ZZZZ